MEVRLCLAALLIAACFSCGTHKKAKGADEAVAVPQEQKAIDCTQQGTVVDYTGLDGCSLLIVTEDGKKYLPVRPEFGGIRLAPGMKIRFGYERADMASVCMAEDAVVTLTCLEAVEAQGGGKPAKKECANILDPFRTPWMADLVKQRNPFKITKYTYEDGWAYYIESGTRNALYDCQGTFLCDVPGRMVNDCSRRITALGGGEVIWVRNNNE